MGIDRKLEGMLPEKPAKGGVTTVADKDLRAAVAALRSGETSAKKWRW
jgi:hypothetical protein